MQTNCKASTTRLDGGFFQASVPVLHGSTLEETATRRRAGDGQCRVHLAYNPAVRPCVTGVLTVTFRETFCATELFLSYPVPSIIDREQRGIRARQQCSSRGSTSLCNTACDGLACHCQCCACRCLRGTDEKIKCGVGATTLSGQSLLERTSPRICMKSCRSVRGSQSCYPDRRAKCIEVSRAAGTRSSGREWGEQEGANRPVSHGNDGSVNFLGEVGAAKHLAEALIPKGSG